MPSDLAPQISPQSFLYAYAEEEGEREKRERQIAMGLRLPSKRFILNPKAFRFWDIGSRVVLGGKGYSVRLSSTCQAKLKAPKPVSFLQKTIIFLL